MLGFDVGGRQDYRFIYADNGNGKSPNALQRILPLGCAMFTLDDIRDFSQIDDAQEQASFASGICNQIQDQGGADFDSNKPRQHNCPGQIHASSLVLAVVRLRLMGACLSSRSRSSRRDSSNARVKEGPSANMP